MAFKLLFDVQPFAWHVLALEWLCIKPGIRERGTEWRGTRGMGRMLYYGECRQTFREMSPVGDYLTQA